MKLLYSVLIALIVSGCASQPQETSVSALKKWDDQFQICFKEEKTSQALFPRTEWFDSLTKEQKINVVRYVYAKKKSECIEPYASNLKTALQKDDIESLVKFFDSLGAFDVPDEALVEGLDREQVDVLVSKATMFSLRNVGRQLGF